MPAPRRYRTLYLLPILLLIVGAGAAALSRHSRRIDDGVETRQLPTPISNTRPRRQTDEQPPSRPSGRLVDSPIRVNLMSNAVPELRLAIDGPFRLRPLEPLTTPVRYGRLSSRIVRATATGLQVGRRRFRTASLEITPDHSPGIWVGDRQYRGSIRLHRLGDGQLIAVNVLPLCDYLASVVDSEMPAAFPRAAREAQAIVARTYALYHMARSAGHPRFDLYASTRSQKYLGFQYRQGDRRLAGESRQSRDIVRSTAGLVCVREGRLIPAYYSAVCGGHTTPGIYVFHDASRLKGVRCEWCREARHYRWSAAIDRTAASRTLRGYFRRNGKPFGRLTEFLKSRPASGPEEALFEVGDGKRRHQLSAATLRRALFPSQLRSPQFQATLTENQLHFEGRGSGHGVGLCQWGARGMAQAGHGAAEIVGHYYPGCRLKPFHPRRAARNRQNRD